MVPKTFSKLNKGRLEADEEEQEREEMLLEESSGQSEAPCQERTPQIWLPTADIDQDQAGVSLRVLFVNEPLP